MPGQEYEMTDEELEIFTEMCEDIISAVDGKQLDLILPALLRVAVSLHIRFKGIEGTGPSEVVLFNSIIERVTNDIIDSTNKFIIESN